MIYALIVFFAYCYVTGCTMLTAFFLSVVLCLLLRRTLHIGMKPFFAKLYLPCLALVCAASLWLCYHPIVTCDAETRTRLSAEERDALASVGKGFYSRSIPLFPVWVELQTAKPPAVHEEITVHYLYAGTAVYSHWAYGYNCEKPLFRWNPARAV